MRDLSVQNDRGKCVTCRCRVVHFRGGIQCRSIAATATEEHCSHSDRGCGEISLGCGQVEERPGILHNGGKTIHSNAMMIRQQAIQAIIYQLHIPDVNTIALYSRGHSTTL